MTFARRVWRETSTGIKVFVAASWLSSAILTILGWRGDATDFWSDRPFMTNLVSSLASALFGIPVALLVLQRLTAQQTEHAARVNILPQTVEAFDNLGRVLDKIIPGKNQGALYAAQTSLRELAVELAKADETRPVPDITADQIGMISVWIRSLLPESGEFQDLIAESSLYIERLNTVRSRRFDPQFGWAKNFPERLRPLTPSPQIEELLLNAERHAVRTTVGQDPGDWPVPRTIYFVDEALDRIAELFRLLGDKNQISVHLPSERELPD